MLLFLLISSHLLSLQVFSLPLSFSSSQHADKLSFFASYSSSSSSSFPLLIVDKKRNIHFLKVNARRAAASSSSSLIPSLAFPSSRYSSFIDTNNNNNQEIIFLQADPPGGEEGLSPTPIPNITVVRNFINVPMVLCDDMLGMYDVRASSYYKEQRSGGLVVEYLPRNGLLASPAYGWRPLSDSSTEWIQTDLGENRIITRVITQGCKVEENWVSKLKIQYSVDMELFRDYIDPSIDSSFLTANKDATSLSNMTIFGKFSARWVRLVPLEWTGHVCMKFQVFGCHDYTGPQGDRGDRGPVGERGAQGPKGLDGPKGDPGPRGDIGERGDPGIQGSKGDRGDPGPQGRVGAKGETGDRGLQGPVGDMGAQGLPGEKGETGMTGPRGLQGPKGFTGVAGKDGPQGEKGERGDQGEKGERGAAGTDGIDGARGPPGDPGHDGLPGLPGAPGPPGPKGSPGRDGLNGKDGPAGPPGDPGPENPNNAIEITQLEAQVKELSERIGLPVPAYIPPMTRSPPAQVLVPPAFQVDGNLIKRAQDQVAELRTMLNRANSPDLGISQMTESEKLKAGEALLGPDTPEAMATADPDKPSPDHELGI